MSPRPFIPIPGGYKKEASADIGEASFFVIFKWRCPSVNFFPALNNSEAKMGRRKERKLYSKVMRAIAEVILSDHYDGDDEGFDHFCESAKEHAAKILVSVKGAFYPMPDGRKEYQYGNYLRIEDPSVIEKNAYLQELVTTKHLDEAVRAFFGICSYDFLGSKTNALEVGELWGPNPRLEFKPDIYWKPLFDSFAENGFGRWTGDSFCWDERIQQYL